MKSCFSITSNCIMSYLLLKKKSFYFEEIKSSQGKASAGARSWKQHDLVKCQTSLNVGCLAGFY